MEVAGERYLTVMQGVFFVLVAVVHGEEKRMEGQGEVGILVPVKPEEVTPTP